MRGVLMPKSAGTPDGAVEVWQVSEAGVDKKATIASDARDGEDAVQKAWDTGRKRCSVSAKPKKTAENCELAANFAAELRERDADSDSSDDEAVLDSIWGAVVGSAGGKKRKDDSDEEDDDKTLESSDLHRRDTKVRSQRHQRQRHQRQRPAQHLESI